MSTPVVVGRVSKLFGLAGEVIINLYDTFPGEIHTEEPLLVSIDSLTVPLFLEKFERRGRSGALIRFADFDTPERVTELLGLELSMLIEDDEEERDDDVIYLEDFVGFTALFTGGESNSGMITAFIEHDHNPLFALDIDGREAFVPATDELIEDFDLEARTVTFSLPEGLLELYL